MKKHYKKIILLFIITIPLFFSVLTYNGLCAINEQLNFEFNEEILIQDSNLYFDDFYNVRNQSSYTEIYNATYTFTNDTIGNNPTSWTVDESAGTIEVIESHYSHNKVVEMIDTNGGDTSGMSNSFTGKSTGIIEMWIRINTTNQGFTLLIQDGSSSHTLRLYFEPDGNIKYQDSTGTYIIQAYITNFWYHIKIDFDCTDDWHLWLNGISTDSGIGYGYVGSPSAIDSINLDSYTLSTQLYLYIDAIDYSWDSLYKLNRNIFPLENVSNITEIDKYKFDMENINKYYENGSDNPSTWTDEESAGDNVNIASSILPYDNSKVVRLESTANGISGLTRNFDITSNKVFISFRWIFSYTENWNSGTSFDLDIYSSDLTLINRIRMNAIDDYLNMTYYDGVSYNLLYPNLMNNSLYDINILIDYYLNISTLKLKIDDVNTANYIFPLITNGKSGIGKINPRYITSGVSKNNDIDIYEIGVYDNGISISNDFGYYSIPSYLILTSENWLFNQHNLFDIDIYGNINTTISTSTIHGIESNLIRNYSIYNTTNINFFKNIYNESLYNISNPSIFFYFYGNITNYYEININLKISGASLNQNTNKYWLEYAFGNVDIDDNYFYVDSLNRLQFNLTTNDNNTEYIQATFDINDISSTNRFLGFYANLFGQATATFRVQFLAISNIVILDNIDRSYNEIISQDLTIDKIVLLITDDDSLNTESTIGNYRSIRLRYSTTQTTIITLMLISMLIPIIIIFIPPIAISNLYGRNLTVPLILLTSTICVVSYLIPTWVFFIIGFCSMLFIFSKKDDLLEGK